MLNFYTIFLGQLLPVYWILLAISVNTIFLTGRNLWLDLALAYIQHILALLDYVSRAHETEIRQSSVSQLSLTQRTKFFRNLVVAAFGSHARDFCWRFEKQPFPNCQWFFFFAISLTWDPMGAKISNDTPSNHCQFFSNFSSFFFQWSSENCVWDFFFFWGGKLKLSLFRFS